jgi:hypothetical protein
MYTTPKDSPLRATFKEAGKLSAQFAAHGHRDWRLPTPGELDVLFKNRTAIGGFDASGLRYWSSMGHDFFFAQTKRFSDGRNEGWNRRQQFGQRYVRG